MVDLESLEKRHQGMIRHFVWDLCKVIEECSRVLKQKGRAVFVVGDSAIGGVFIKNSAALIQLAESNGLTLVSRNNRSLDIKKRYLPPPQSDKAGDNFSNRMREEVILEFRRG
jgi:hypothetical protein